MVTRKTDLEIVVPVFNEALALQHFHEALTTAVDHLPYSIRFLYVDDGSEDGSGQLLDQLSTADPRVAPIKFSRNFGHQAALSAGIDASVADVLIMMDGDGEHPVALLAEMLRLFEMGYDIVQTQRLDRSRQGYHFKRLTGQLFYGLINLMGDTKIIEGAADFRLLSRGAVQALRQLPEYHRFYRGMVQWIGFKSVTLPYVPSTRLAGKPKYTLRKMLKLAGDGMFSFSLVPLRLGLLVGMTFLLLAGGELLYIASFLIRGTTTALVPGWSSLMLVLTVSSGISMLLTGILGIYIGMIFQEVKQRPLYLVKSGSQADVATAVKSLSASSTSVG